MEVSTSLLSVKKEDIIQTIYNLEVAHTDYFHIDVMDGRFVENDTSETMRIYCEYLNQVTNVPIDVHLMVTNVKEYIDSYSIFNPNIITFHYEACKDDTEVDKYIEQIKGRECKVGLAIKPNTEIDKILKFLPKINLLLIMSVEPGKGGQKFIDFIPFIQDCKYVGCSHIYESEKECGVKRAVLDGKISKSRYENFVKIYKELEENYKRRYN